jgi:hypothetical protein
MEEKATLIESLFEKAEAYIKTNIELIKLKAIDKLSDLMSTIASMLILFVMACMLFILINIGLALWIGQMLGGSYYGFFIVALFYLLVMLILFFAHGYIIKRPISNSLILHFLKEKQHGKH